MNNTSMNSDATQDSRTYDMTISDADGDNPESSIVTFLEFSEANESDMEIVEELGRLQVGQKAVFGGGAQPLFELVRKS